ncbi:hypothetical protein JW964_19310 [candidate division KSB1 bacterium]|nr:hypothetical protein [candidate division KSB1 bacterium]
MKSVFKYFLMILMLLLVYACDTEAQHLELVKNRVTGTHNGNLIRTRFTNYGILGHRTEKPSMEWPKGSGTEFGLEFAMFAGARITDDAWNQYYIFTESYSDPYNIDEDPTGSYSYSWEPLPGYINNLLPEGQRTVAMSNIPESWPAQWIYDYPGNPGSRDGFWNGEFQAAPIADQESYYVMVDWNNKESPYLPFETDSTKAGLGLQVKVRTYQWSDPLAEDIMITIYDITNTSDKLLRDVVFGMYVDADVSGPLYDVMSFDPTGDINITYQWDKLRKQDGYFGFAFLESPGDDSDGIDNDEDGLIDESRESGQGVWIEDDDSPYMMQRYKKPRSHWSGDEDGDWDPQFHDTGSDGLLRGEEYYPGPDADGTEGNGMPDDGEPNFDRTDLTESDQIGLTSFSTAHVNDYKLRDDKVLYERTEPGEFRIEGQKTVTAKQRIDIGGNVEFVYGSAYFPLRPGQTERFSVASVFGNNEFDILGNKEIMQRIYDDNYRFATPPVKPTLMAYATDGQVLLTWNDIAEISYDEIYGHDFEGYILYKATDPEFNEIKTITDNMGNPFYYEPLAQFDLVDGIKGSHPIAAGSNITGKFSSSGILIEREVKYAGNGVHFHLGDDTGLKHHYVDNDVQNGRTYYYAVVAYDKGYDLDYYEKGWSDRRPHEGFKPIYPVQNSKTITQDVVGNIIFNDRNTAVVVPNAAAAGAELARLNDKTAHTGPATGEVKIMIANPDLIKPGHQYSITFEDTSAHRKTSALKVTNETENKVVHEKPYPEIIETENSVELQGHVTVEGGLFDGLLILMKNSNPTNYKVVTSSFSAAYDINPDTTLYGKSFNIYIDLLPKYETGYHSNENNEIVDIVNSLEFYYPSSYEMTFYDHIVDTTYSNSPNYQFPVNFLVIDIDEQDTLSVLAVDPLRHNTIRHGDQLVLLKQIDDSLRAICKVGFSEKDKTNMFPPFVVPKPGSKFLFECDRKNFTHRDAYSFSVKAATFAKTEAKDQLSRISVVPDSYIATTSWEKPLHFTFGRGERRVDFIHLPPVCTIRIFTLNGKLVRILEHNSVLEDGHHSWDLTSQDDLNVAYGNYIYHVDAPGIGKKMGRFALIK